MALERREQVMGRAGVQVETLGEIAEGQATALAREELLAVYRQATKASMPGDSASPWCHNRILTECDATAQNDACP
jgi:hypothetical protein